ncbi:MAG: hypothetical protein ACJ0QE_00005 [Flavobacteriaceae bacterium]
MRNIYDRLLMIIENEDISIAAFERNIGVGRNSISSAIRNQSSIGHEVLSKICKHYPQYNIDWIVNGKDSDYIRGLEMLVKMKKLLKTWGYNPT